MKIETEGDVPIDSFSGEAGADLNDSARLL